MASMIPRSSAFSPAKTMVGSARWVAYTTTASNYLFMTTDPTYGLRKEQFGIEDKELLKKISSMDNAVLVDVRNEDEIEALSCNQPFVAAKYLLNDNIDDDTMSKDLPDKNAHHIVFCAKGGRANKACANLRKNGYQNVYNAGGITDIDFLDE